MVDSVGAEIDAEAPASAGLDQRGAGEALDEGLAPPVSAQALFLTWVEGHFAVIEYVHTEKRAPWCPEWWKHPEVVARLWAVWLARNQSAEDAATRLDAESDWWLTHWDRHAAILFDSRTGPFRKCDRTLGHLHETDGEAVHAVPFERPPGDWVAP